MQSCSREQSIWFCNQEWVAEIESHCFGREEGSSVWQLAEHVLLNFKTSWTLEIWLEYLRVGFFFSYSGSICKWEEKKKLKDEKRSLIKWNKKNLIRIKFLPRVCSRGNVVVLTNVSWGFNYVARITAEFRLEQSIRGHLVKPHCNEQGHLQLSQVFRVLSSLTLNVCRDGAHLWAICASVSPWSL